MMQHGLEELIYLDLIAAALQEVLGRPNFVCAPFAHSMRAADATIKPRSENERSAVLHGLIKLSRNTALPAA
ncbi:hypothetical protein CFB89_07170 [Burkholderia sp. AU16741]|uniref:hypothetical protein n=1 Tax=Burkholderia sp. AU16741 TaxID=2015347 RepID=UPI000B7A1827|nr:hypothetical protein [Burkholderia sp. AU16741]OXI34531.1 hypothetical protein CFB89_07170 [Burkholderia sp. AU16741]